MTRPPPRSSLFPYTTRFRSIQMLGIAAKMGGLDLQARRAAQTIFKLLVILQLRSVALHIAVNTLEPDVRLGDMNQGHKIMRSEEHTSELQSRPHLVCRLLLE